MMENIYNFKFYKTNSFFEKKLKKKIIHFANVETDPRLYSIQ
jgi:hypothetical protein